MAAAKRDDDFFEIMQQTGRSERLEAELRAFEAEPYDIGEALVEIRGGVDWRMYGVDLTMAARAIDSYCRLVHHQAKRLSGGTSHTSFRLASTIAGDMGFVIREVERPTGEVSHAAQAMHDVAVTIADVISDGGARSRIGLGKDDPLLSELDTLFGILDDANAMLSITEGEFDHAFSREDIARGRAHIAAGRMPGSLDSHGGQAGGLQR